MAEGKDKGKKHQCVVSGCTMSYKYEFELERHRKIVHVFAYYQCQYCKSIFKEHRKKEQHEKDEHSDGASDPRVHNSMNTAWSHSDTTMEYRCHDNKNCQRYPPENYATFEQHVERHNEKDRVIFATNSIICSRCNVEYSTRFGYESHQEECNEKSQQVSK